MGKGDNDMSKKKTLTILLTKGPYVSESADMAIQTALKAKKMGYNVNIFIYLDGVWNAHIKEEKGFNNPGEWIKWAIKKGINVSACERCSKARDLDQSDILDGIKISGSYKFIDMLKESDKVLTFGG